MIKFRSLTNHIQAREVGTPDLFSSAALRGPSFTRHCHRQREAPEATGPVTIAAAAHCPSLFWPASKGVLPILLWSLVKPWKQSVLRAARTPVFWTLCSGAAAAGDHGQGSALLFLDNESGKFQIRREKDLPAPSQKAAPSVICMSQKQTWHHLHCE